MKKMRIFAIALVFISTSIQAAELRIELKMGYQYPSDRVFRDIYGGGLKYGGEASISVWKGLAVWLEGSRFVKEGELTFTKERTKVQIIPLGLGIRYSLPLHDKLDLYAGAGLQYSRFKEENPIGEVQESQLGYVAKLGLNQRISKGVLIDVFAEYSYCRMKPADFEFDIGGLSAGVGVGYEF